MLPLIDIVGLLGEIPPLPTWDPATPHDISGRVSRDAAVSHGIPHGISRNVPWESTRKLQRETSVGAYGIPWGAMRSALGLGF